MPNGAVDKLEFRLPKGTNMTRPVTDFLRRLGSPRKYMTVDPYYEQRIGLRACGSNSILHLHNRFNGNHKLELVGVGQMNFAEILQQIKVVCECDPVELGIMRIDCAADVVDFSVHWFRTHARVRQKRHYSEFGQFRAEYGKVETLYFGKRPNCIRIYDKIEELRTRYQREIRRYGDRSTPCFEKTYGYPEAGVSLTRVERQYGAGRVPAEIRTLASLRRNGKSFNPFQPIEFLPFPISDELVFGLKGNSFLRTYAVSKLIEDFGYAGAKKILDEKTSRNARRVLGAISSHFESNDQKQAPDLCETFRKSLERQLSA
jgi:hypothetical protein